MTRIIAGTHGGRRLQTPPGDATRPTTDRVREALFSALLSEFGSFEGLRFLDLFAGSGAIGLEALSRGAASADLVEHDRQAASIIQANIADLGMRGAQVTVTTAERFLQRPRPTPYDVIFLDPPYAHDADDLTRILESLADPAWSSPAAMFVVERGKRDRFAWPEGFEATKQKKYGETNLWYGHCHG